MKQIPRISKIHLITVALMGCFALAMYWLLTIFPYLKISDARLVALSQEIRADRMGRLAYVPYEDGAHVNQGDCLFSFNTQSEK